MKHTINHALRIAYIVLACTVAGNTQTSGAFNRLNIKDTMTLSGSRVAEIVTTISGTSKNNELPTAKAVYDEVQAHTVTTTARLSGAGTSGSALDIAQQSATTAQVLRWSGSAWTPNGLNLYDFTTTTGSMATTNNEVWVGTLSASITLNLPACNSTNDKTHIDVRKVGTDDYALVIEPAGSEAFIDGETSKSLYSANTGISCTCRWTGSVGVWLFIFL